MQALFQTEYDSNPPPNIHIFLPSGIAIIGIDSWVERFTKIFNKGAVIPGHSQILPSGVRE